MLVNNQIRKNVRKLKSLLYFMNCCYIVVLTSFIDTINFVNTIIMLAESDIYILGR